MSEKICKKESFKDCEIGTVKKIETKKGRLITIKRVKPHGKNGKLITKIISNEKI